MRRHALTLLIYCTFFVIAIVPLYLVLSRSGLSHAEQQKSNLRQTRLAQITLKVDDRTSCRIWEDWIRSDKEWLLHARVPTTFKPSIGDAGIIGSATVCMTASSRLNPYRGSSAPNGRSWNDTRWGEVQARCAAKDTSTVPNIRHRKLSLQPFDDEPVTPVDTPRTAIVIRTWDDYNYSNDNQMAWLRAFITETSLHSHGQMQVFFLVNVKDNDTPIFDDPILYESKLRGSVPEEFLDISLLWNERLLESWYPNVEDHSPKLQMYQALQVFAKEFQDYQYFWQIEMDLRFTGHAYRTLYEAGKWAAKQPRKNLWERNGRWYLPSLYNDSYADFAANVSNENSNGVWGPVETSDFQPLGPTSPSKDDVQWGIGEEADLITIMPMMDQKGSDWVYEETIHNFTDGLDTPRRYAIVAVSRTSRNLLHLVHSAQRSHGQWLASEAMMPTFSLLHGLKAVYVPHGISYETDKTDAQLDAHINAGPPHCRAGGYHPDVAYTTGGFVNLDWGQSSFWWWPDQADTIWKNYTDGQCLPSMILHPVKNDRPAGAKDG